MDRGHDLKATLEDPSCKELHSKFGQGHMKRKTTERKKLVRFENSMTDNENLETFTDKKKTHTLTHTHTHTDTHTHIQ